MADQNNCSVRYTLDPTKRECISLSYDIVTTSNAVPDKNVYLKYARSWFRGGHLLPLIQLDQSFFIQDGPNGEKIISMDENDKSSPIPFNDNIDLKIMYQDNRSVHPLVPMMADMFITTQTTTHVSQDALEFLLRWIFEDLDRLPSLTKWRSMIITQFGKLILAAH